MKLLIYGTGGTGREALWIAKLINQKENRWDEVGFIDDITNEKTMYGHSCYKFEYIKEIFSKDEVEICIGVGEPFLREKLWNKVEEAGYRFASIIHPDAIIMDDVVIGRGVIIKAGVTVSCGATIEDNVGINTLAVVGHDTVIKKNTFLASHSMVAANSIIGKNVFLGLQAGVREKVVVGDGSIISMGACVMKDVPEGVIAMGNPARVIQKNQDNQVFK